MRSSMPCRPSTQGCFIIMLQSNEVHGEGFRQLELGKNENRNE